MKIILIFNICVFQLLQERADKICEMAGVMQRSVQIDEENQAREQELMSRLITENKVKKHFLFLQLLSLGTQAERS
jgi:hypothetical protein